MLREEQNKSGAAKRLGITRATLHRWLRDAEIKDSDWKGKRITETEEADPKALFELLLKTEQSNKNNKYFLTEALPDAPDKAASA